jgi:flagellar biosynthesis/type III secretory pathway chaperone
MHTGGAAGDTPPVHYKKGDAIIIMETSTPWNQLIELLEGQIELYRTLLDLIDQESRALMTSNLPVFTQLIGHKKELVKKLKRKETERSAWMAAHTPTEASKNLRALAGRAPRVVSRRLRQCRRELVDLTQRLDLRNQLHSRMLNHSSELAGNALRLLGNQLNLQPIYQSNGHISGTSNGGAVLSDMA